MRKRKRCLAGLVEMRALFLDRDGVINVDHGHVGTRARFEFSHGVFDMARVAVSLSYGLFIITNQAGIARGLYSEEDFQKLMGWVGREFKKYGAPIIKVYHCPHHPDYPMSDAAIGCDCRKPAPGLLLRAAREFEIDMDASIMVGDKESDMLAGLAAGVGSLVLMGTGPIDVRWHCAASMEELSGLLSMMGGTGWVGTPMTQRGET